MADGGHYPIVYVRGYGGGTNSIDSAADDPFYGFNAGATHVRVGGDGSPQFYQFEGPLVRLMQDEGYQVLVRGNQQAFLNNPAPDPLPQRSIWIYRFYDSAADTFGAKTVPFDLPTAADLLLPFVQQVRAKTGADKVLLVAHSMGGLICRSMMQRTCPDQGIDAKSIVDKFFTYATPHNGIEFSIGPIDIPVPEIAPVGAQIFNREVMHGYLTPADKLPQEQAHGWDAHDIPPERFDSGRIFCLIGTDAQDYGTVSKFVGPKSDGLVQIDNAYVHNASRAFVHRSHSGRYGIVNSEEGYQNLRRFLFGTRKVDIDLVGAQLPAAASGGNTDVWQAEASISIRGLPVLITDEVAAHYCPIQLGSAGAEPGDVPVAVTFLMPADHEAGRVRYALSLRLLHLQQHHGFLVFGNHLETSPEWSDHLIVDVGPDPETGTERLWAAWASQFATVTSRTDPIGPLCEPTSSDGALTFTIPLPPQAGDSNVLGPAAAVRLTVQPWA